MTQFSARIPKFGHKNERTQARYALPLMASTRQAHRAKWSCVAPSFRTAVCPSGKETPLYVRKEFHREEPAEFRVPDTIETVFVSPRREFRPYIEFLHLASSQSEGTYSYRSADVGSISVARRAGSHAARPATAANNNVTEARLTGS